MNTDWSPLRVASYARYSSDKQSEQSIPDQLRVCAKFIEQRGGVVRPEFIFTDEAVSGSSLQRSGFEALMRAVEHRPREIDIIVVEDVSRITRDLADWGSVAKRLRFAGVELVSVQEGISTNDRHSKFTLGFKAMVAEEYLDNLRDKTRRGMEGRALRGHSTGLLPIGYRSTPVPQVGGSPAHIISIDEERAETVRLIFKLCSEGMSYGAIAKRLNDVGVVPPRGSGRRRFEGWAASGVRAILFNSKYVGEWRWNERIFIKKPGTNQRISRPRPEADIVRTTFEDRRIVPQELWEAVQARLKASRSKYAGTRGDQRGRPTPHLLSGVLFCGECSSVMTLHGGQQGRRYYRCDARAKRGTCENPVSVREEIARERILDELRRLLTTNENIAYVRERLVERLAQRDRDSRVDAERARSALVKVEEKVQRLVQFISEGGSSKAIGTELKALEARAAELQRDLAEAQAERRAPTPLPTTELIMRRVLDIRTMLEREPVAGREALRSLLVGGEIRINREFIARARVLPLAVFLGAEPAGSPTSGPETKKPPSVSREAAAAWYKSGCGGLLRRLCNEATVARSWRLVADAAE